ncbi:MAG: Gfo/Idh/MocA family oxidoreductase [Anaerolineaceae bacterium]|nr:MAG: Gfo/Idh/MocA family oxidoreductase [Anaerolineaceae bacterium]
MKKTINWGIIGPGGIAHKFAQSAAVVDGAEVVAAASRTPGKAKAFAVKYGIENYYTGYAEMLSNDDVDAVYVATTHNFHYENVKQVLEAGKAVLCEKPLTVNAAEMCSLIALAEQKQLFMMEAMWTRFLPALEQVRAWLAQDVIGTVKQVRATFGFRFPYDPEHRLFNPDLAGGAVLDAGIYPLSFANMVMRQKPVEVKALGDIGATGVDEQSSYLLKYESGCLALLNATMTAPVASRAEVIGSEGRITIPRSFLNAQEVWLELADHEPIQKKFPHEDSTGFKFEIEAASESIRNGLLENEIMPLSDTLQLMETIDEIKNQLGLVYANDMQY